MTVAMAPVIPHAVSRQRTERLARSSKPFLARGGPRGERIFVKTNQKRHEFTKFCRTISRRSKLSNPI